MVINSRHVLTLRRYSHEMPVNQASADFAEMLADGPSDLLVVLLEPLDYFRATTLAEGISKSHALRQIDQNLRKFSANTRSILNTAVFDIRVFISAKFRATLSKSELREREARSFTVFQEMVEDLSPVVIISCQCATRNSPNPTLQKTSEY